LRRQHPDDPIPAQLSELPGFTDASRVARSVDYGPESVARGRRMYQNACAPCHQMTGEGMPGRNYGVKTLPRDLREPEYYRYGSSDRALYRTIVHGIPGSPMGSFDGMPPEMAWDLVHYVRSLYKPEMP
jgi:cytochrome c